MYSPQDLTQELYYKQLPSLEAPFQDEQIMTTNQDQYIIRQTFPSRHDHKGIHRSLLVHPYIHSASTILKLAGKSDSLKPLISLSVDNLLPSPTRMPPSLELGNVMKWSCSPSLLIKW